MLFLQILVRPLINAVPKNKKIEKLYYSIGEVATMLDVSPSSIRYWEKHFDELTPKKSRGGARLFSSNDIKALKLIQFLLRERKLTVEGAKASLKNNLKEVEHSAEIVNRLKKVRDKLIQIRDELEVI